MSTLLNSTQLGTTEAYTDKGFKVFIKYIIKIQD